MNAMLAQAPQVPQKDFTPSLKQSAIFNAIQHGTGSLLVIAVAGSGKSTTMVESLAYTEERDSILMLAFNSTIAADLRGKIAKLGARLGRDFRNVRACTFHALGYSAICKRLGKRMDDVKPDTGKVRKLARKLWDEDTYKLYGSFCVSLVGMAKGEGLRTELCADEVREWERLVDHHDLTLDSEEATMDRAIELARELLIQSNKAAIEGSIDFDDQIYLPVLWKLALWQNRFVYVDEAQDTNPVRRALARKALKPAGGRWGGRLVAVGDPKQSIYGFCHPPGTLVKTPDGLRKIESLKVGDPVVVGSTSGEVSGRAVKEIHKYHHTGLLVRLNSGGRTVDMTPHHRVPVRIDGASYYTYMMRRLGVYRVGYCQAYTQAGDFMLALRVRNERADAAWLLGAYDNKHVAQEAEKRLLFRVKGTTFNDKTDGQVSEMDTDEVEALKLLGEHGRMVSFPLIVSGSVKPRIARNGAFLTEACNIMDRMKVAYYDDDLIDTRKRGRGRLNMEWTECEVTSRQYSGPVYGITVPTLPTKRKHESWPLYFAGPGQILVHNTGASTDAMDLLRSDFRCTEMPLTVSYRCPKAVGRVAVDLVPYFEVHESAPEGEVRYDVTVDELLASGLTERDAVLCRNTRPLVSLAYRLLAQGVACRVLGSEIGKGLIDLIEKMNARTVDGLRTKLTAYRDREVEKAVAEEDDAKANAVEDRVACVLTFMDNLGENECTIGSLVRKIEALFGDGQGDVLTLCTAHKAKGKEWPTVAILEPQLMPGRARRDWQHEQELNLMYVAATRAQERLVYMAPEEV